MIFKKAGNNQWGIVDMHCHILPGVDDGARNLSETLSMLSLAVEEGITDIIATPHFHIERHTARKEMILRLVEWVQNEAEAVNIPIKLYPGSEVFYFEELSEYLKNGRICTLNGTKRLLIEFSPTVMFLTMQNAMDRLLNCGYRPILAHAERYACLLKDMDNVRLLYNMDVQIQINASTVIGGNGMEGKRFAQRLLKEELVDYIGTDAHDSLHRAPEISKCREMVIKRYGDAFAYQLMRGNADKILRSRMR